MEVSINPKENNDINWPSECAICGEHADATAIATSARGTGYYVVAWTEKISKLVYPICRSHRVRAWFLDIPGKLGFIKGVVLFLFSPIMAVPFLILISVLTGKKGPEMSQISNILIWVSYICAAGFYLYARYNRPIALKELTEDQILLEVKSESFAKKMTSLNSQKTNKSLKNDAEGRAF